MRRYPTIPDIGNTLESHTTAFSALREKADVYERNTKNIRNSFVRVEDLIDLGLVKLNGKNIQFDLGLNGLQDVETVGAVDGDLLAFDEARGLWVPVPASAGGSLALDDLTDVDAPTPTTGDVLTFDGADWVSAAPSASGSENITPDTHPASPDAMDDEHEGGSLDAKWSWVNQAGALESRVSGALIMESSLASATTNNSLLVQVAPSAPWRFRVKFGVKIPTVNGGAGLCFYNSGNQKLLVWGHFNNANADGTYLQRCDNPTTFNANVSTGNTGETFVGLQSDPVYWEIASDGTNLTMLWNKAGYEGMATLFYTEAIATHLGAVTHVGYFTNGVSTSDRAKLYSDSFRRVA